MARAEVTPALRERLAAAPEGRVAVVVTLAEQVDPGRYHGRPAALLRALCAVAARTQPTVLALAGARADRRLWITNAMAMTVSPATARRLARMPEVAAVDVDRRIAAAQAPGLSPPPGHPSSGGESPLPPAIGFVQSVTQLPLDAIGARAVWSRCGLRNEGMLLGSIDTGVDAGNPDLAGKIAAFRDFVNGRPRTTTTATASHSIGTMTGGNASGQPIGAAPAARAIVAKAMGADGQGLGSQLLGAAQWMADPDGNPATADQPTVVNNSWTGGDASDPWFRQVVRVWRSVGIVPVFAAGNSRPGDRRAVALRRLAALEREYRAALPPACAAGRRIARRAEAARARARRGAGRRHGRRAGGPRGPGRPGRAPGAPGDPDLRARGPGGRAARPAAAAGIQQAPPPAASAPGVGPAGPASVPVTLRDLVDGRDIDLAPILGEHQLPADLDLLDLDRLDDRTCRGIAVICLGADKPLLNGQLKELVNRYPLPLALRNLTSGDLAGILTKLGALLDRGELRRLVSVQRVSDQVLRLAPMGALDALSGLPDVPGVVIGRLQVVGVRRCPPAEVDGLPRVCVA